MLLLCLFFTYNEVVVYQSILYLYLWGYAPLIWFSLIYTTTQLDLCHYLYILLCSSVFLYVCKWLSLHSCSLPYSVLPCYLCWSSLMLPCYCLLPCLCCYIYILISIRYIYIDTITPHSHYPPVLNICAHVWLFN